MTASLAYRQNTAAIMRGDVPAKYTRLLPYIPRGRIVELGSAEGVLALLLAGRGDDVTAVERKAERHETATALRNEWLSRGLLTGNGSTRHIHGDAQDYLDLLAPGAFDVLVAVRVVYYFGAELDSIFATIAEKIPTVVLCGNRGRARRYHEGNPDQPLGEFNYYAGAAGMKDLLTRHGYRIVDEVTEGDAIVVGRKDN